MPLYSEYLRKRNTENVATMNPRNQAPQPFKNEPFTFTYKARKDGDPPPTGPTPPKPPAGPIYPTYPYYPSYPTHSSYPQYCAPQPPYAYPPYQFNPQYQCYPVYSATSGPVPTQVPAQTPVGLPPVPGQLYYTPYPGYNPYYPYPTALPPAPSAAKVKYPWYGRTRTEVQEDNAITSAYTGGYNSHSWEPVGVSHETQYHVLEKDGVTQNTYPYGTIKNSFDGYWAQHNGITYFVRKKD
jgi:hypothetical protein